MERVKQNDSKSSSKKRISKKNIPRRILYLVIIFCTIIGSIVGLFTIGFGAYFEYSYQNKIYPGIHVGELNASGKTKQEIEDYYTHRSFPFSQIRITLSYQDVVATISGSELKVAYDGKLSADQAYSLGRSGHFLGDTYQKLTAAKKGIYLPVVLRMDNDFLDDILSDLSQRIDIEPKDALFKFEKGKVAAFRVSQSGLQTDRIKTKQLINGYLSDLTALEHIDRYDLTIPIPVNTLYPSVTTENSNQYGIKELIGEGRSKFAHSIPGRVANVALAAARIDGRLIAPGATFSFNDALGDVSAATGFQPAYIIKDGKTVLGDGGGVCQVSTTLFRAALNAGLPITERWAHAYRVGYYEQDSPPGLDATVYAPGNDLKIQNNMSTSVLIQAYVDTNNMTLVFDLYGSSDGRKSEITTPKVYAQSPPPPDLYQDDPTLNAGVIKQTDFAAWGAKVDFNYKVTRDGQVLTQQDFFSNYRPWQAVYLRGTKT